MIRNFLLIFCTIFFFNVTQAASLDKFILEKPVKFEDIEFFGENGQKYNLSDFKGNVVLLNFWATWCKPCVAEMPLISELQEKVKGQKVKIIPLSLDFEGVEVVRKFYDKLNLDNLNIYHDSNETIIKTLKLKALPTTIILNEKGDKIAQILGEIDWSSDEVKDYLINPKTKPKKWFWFF